eukprot:CAMPEP_0179907902 /NCGR_PEP_ID=MMETSP0982-20121206/44218_1 /TAXON_ID=483367 /ORGANISM="non described non described, Strain CCMP 2436" /LENGTH=155 /DNA_ID=CAMNT_0021808893 /DNA_START=206 /DNA_END=673 /DNA_ORIENTATION=-
MRQLFPLRAPAPLASLGPQPPREPRCHGDDGGQAHQIDKLVALDRDDQVDKLRRPLGKVEVIVRTNRVQDIHPVIGDQVEMEHAVDRHKAGDPGRCPETDEDGTVLADCLPESGDLSLGWRLRLAVGCRARAQGPCERRAEVGHAARPHAAGGGA